MSKEWIDCPHCHQGHLSPVIFADVRKLKPGYVRCERCLADARQEYSGGFWAQTAVNAVGFLVDSGEISLLAKPQQYLDQNALKPPTMDLMVYFKMCWWEAAVGELMPNALVTFVNQEQARRNRG